MTPMDFEIFLRRLFVLGAPKVAGLVHEGLRDFKLGWVGVAYIGLGEHMFVYNYEGHTVCMGFRVDID